MINEWGSLWATGGIVALVAAGYKNILLWLDRIKKIFICSVRIENHSLRRPVLGAILNSGFRPVTMTHILSICKYTNCKSNQMEKVAVRKIPDSSTLYYGGGLRFLTVNGGDFEISYFRLWKSIHKLINEAVIAEEGESTSRYFYILRKHGSIGRERRNESPEEVNGSNVATAEDDLYGHPEVVTYLNKSRCKADYIKRDGDKHDDLHCLSDDCKEAEKGFKYWLKSQIWCESRKICWKRGWLLHGPPGTGKTSFIRHVAMKYGVPVVIVDLSTCTNEDLSRIWSNNIMPISPVIVLLEDIDGIFHGRKNVATKDSMTKGLTFDALLNQIDGIDVNSGVFTVITTNCIDKVDPALIRPGRVDRIIETWYMTKEQRMELANKILDDFSEEEKMQLVEKTKGESGATVHNVFTEKALCRYWGKLNTHEDQKLTKRIKNEENTA